MKITQTTPSSITIEHEGRRVKIMGEAYTRGYGSPDFVVFSDSIRHWEGGSDTDYLKISANEKETIIDFVLSELRSRGWIIESE